MDPLTQFKTDLRSKTSQQMFRKYILDGQPSMIGADAHLQLKEAIAAEFKVDFTEVYLVGSSKLGFSIKPQKRFVAFGDESDIDVAIISKSYFEQVWEAAFIYASSKADWPKRVSFFEYLSRGWVRPDKFPRSAKFQHADRWWDFFTELTSSRVYGPYPIRAGLYYSMFFFEEYQRICLDQCRPTMGGDN